MLRFEYKHCTHALKVSALLNGIVRIELLLKAKPSTSTAKILTTVELQWLAHFWDHENMFETGVVRATEC